MGIPPSWPHLTLVTSQRPPPPISMNPWIWELSFQHEFWRECSNHRGCLMKKHENVREAEPTPHSHLLQTSFPRSSTGPAYTSKKFSNPGPRDWKEELLVSWFRLHEHPSWPFSKEFPQKDLSGKFWTPFPELYFSSESKKLTPTPDLQSLYWGFQWLHKWCCREGQEGQGWTQELLPIFCS